VLIDGTRHFPRAAEALREFRAGGGTVALITNASRPSAGVARQPGKARAAAAHASSTCSGAASRTGASNSAESAVDADEQEKPSGGRQDGPARKCQ
jgi:ribonucleotide monophosphatase NagD (HAD superfamily)